MGEDTRVGVVYTANRHTVACRSWRKQVRLAMYLEFHKRGIEVVSDNEVYELIFNLKRVPPPPLRADNQRVGLARSSVFTECEGGLDCYYEPTKRTILSTDPSAKRRKIRIFKYLPELDQRVLYSSRSRRADWSGMDDF